MAYRRVFIFPEIVPHPRNAFASHNMVGINHFLQTGDRGHVPAHNYDRLRRKSAHHAAHFPYLPHINNDGGNPDHIVLIGLQLSRERLARGEIQHRAGCGDVGLNHHDSPRPVKHAHRKTTLGARHLVMK
jgi:hypothetical protein